MSFYKSIASLYDYIFPLNKLQVSFVTSSISNIGNKNLLDIGCGTGNLTLELAKQTKSIMGIDLDKEMLKLAQQKNTEGEVSFLECNMLDLSANFKTPFDAIVCFGNTLVHLNSLNEIDLFLKESISILADEGDLMLQVINYDRILDQQIEGLPTIENEKIKFERIYEFDISGKINFKTFLTDKSKNKTIENNQWLLPIREKDLKDLLKANNFIIKGGYANFKEEVFTSDSIPLIIHAKKL